VEVVLQNGSSVLDVSFDYHAMLKLCMYFIKT
jgi:hypothetical protein